jgi:hypothetical protein
VECICTSAKETFLAIHKDDGSDDTMDQKKESVTTSPAEHKGKRKSEALDTMETPTLQKRGNKTGNEGTSQANRLGTPNLCNSGHDMHLKIAFHHKSSFSKFFRNDTWCHGGTQYIICSSEGHTI